LRGRGDCGSCVVLINGRAATTCNRPLKKVGGQEITTIEGLARGNLLHPVQEAFVKAGAIQCGFCTHGKVLQAKDLLGHCPHPSEEEILETLDSHICRCTGYVKIVEAMQLTSRKMT